MKHRTLGHTGLIVSEVALGSMQFGGKMNMGNLGQEDASRMVKLALDRGVNFIDTADVYSLGESETLLGNALSGIRQEIVLATKVRLPMSDNFNRSGATRVNIMREVEGSLRRLRTDYIDLYQVHGWDSNTPLEETLRTLDDLVRAGKVRYIGLSNLMSWQAATAVMLQDRLGLEKYVTAQMYYSLVGRGLEHEFQSFAEYHDIGILVWSPLAGGFLTSKYSRDNPPPAGSRFADAGQFVPFDTEMGYRVVDALKAVAARHGASPARVAIAWVLSRPAVSSVIIAARKAEQLEDNIRAVDLRLTDDDGRQLDAASDPGIPYPKWMVLQLDTAEDPRSKILHPERYAEGGPWEGFLWDPVVRLNRRDDMTSVRQKIGIIGAGAVGSATLLSTVLRGVAREIVVVNRDPKRARGVVADVQYGATLSSAVDIRAGDYPDLNGATLVMIAAGTNEKAGGATDRSDPTGRLRLLEANAGVYQQILPRLASTVPDAVILVLTDPPDPLADLVRTFGFAHVLSSGTLLDSLRFRFHLARHLNVDAASVHANVLGEHGTSETFVWSSASMSGVPVLEALKLSGEGREAFCRQVEHDVRFANIEIIEGNQASQFGIGMVAARIAQAVLRDERAVVPIGSYNDEYGVTLSMPSVLGQTGVVQLLEPSMSADERRALSLSADRLRKALATLPQNTRE